MAEYRFTLILRDASTLVADPKPTGWENTTIVLERDPRWHGSFWDYGLDRLFFTGQPAAVIQDEYDNSGVNGQMSIKIEYMCSENGRFEELNTFKLNFTEYSRLCGIECNVGISVEDSLDVMAFRNNYDQKVDLTKSVAFNQVTPLADYEGLNFSLPIPSRGLTVLSRGNSDNAQHNFYPITIVWPTINNSVKIRPILTVNIIDEIETADFPGETTYAINQVIPNQPTDLSPVLELDLTPQCSGDVFSYNVRLKGHIQEVTNGSHSVSIQAVVTSEPYPNTGSPALSKVDILLSTNFPSGSGPNMDFDVTMQGTTALNEGQPIYVFLFVASTPGATLRTQDIFVDWDEETFVSITTVTRCDPSPAKSFMINEAISRTVEAITNNDIKFYSETFGRQTSQPYAIDEDTCAGMYAITNGLAVRQKLLQDGTQPGVFVSMRQLFEDLNSLWAIGLNIEDDVNRPGFKRLRFEDWKYYYQNDIGLVFRNPSNVETAVDITRIFNRFLVGFLKWEAEQFTGLDEFMTSRTYRLDISALDQELKMLCEQICSPYTIEITRRLSGTTQDWKYDNDIFGFCLETSDIPVFGAPDVQVEQFDGNVVGVENVLDSDTCYNHRVRPSVNAMRWFSYIIQGIKRVTTSSKLIFSSGTGNYVAKMEALHCNIEGSPIRENDDIDITRFDDVVAAQPITQPEIDTFTHAFSFNMFKRLKNEPTLMFKAIRYVCNNTIFEGWIKSVRYNLEDGQATIQVIPKNELQIPAPVPPCSATILDGNVVINVSDTIPGQVEISFTEGVSGADNWQWTLQQTDGPYFTTGTATEYPLIISGIPPGNYTLDVYPYCGTNIGENVGNGTFSISVEYLVQLSAILSNNPYPDNYMILTATGNIPAPSGFTFKFGQCAVVTTFPPGEGCSGFVGSGAPEDFATMFMALGGTSANEDSTAVTPGSSYGYISKIVIYDLVGITAAQISKAPGQTWTLIIQ